MEDLEFLGVGALEGDKVQKVIRNEFAVLVSFIFSRRCDRDYPPIDSILRLAFLELPECFRKMLIEADRLVPQLLND